MMLLGYQLNGNSIITLHNYEPLKFIGSVGKHNTSIDSDLIYKHTCENKNAGFWKNTCAYTL